MLVGGNCSTDHLGGWSPMFESIHQFRPTALTSPTAVGRGPLSPQKAELSPQHIGEILKQLRPTPTAETVDGTSRVTWNESGCALTGLDVRVAGNCGVPGARSFVGACGAG